MKFNFKKWKEDVEIQQAKQSFIQKAETLFTMGELVIAKCYIEWDEKNRETIVHIVVKVAE